MLKALEIYNFLSLENEVIVLDAQMNVLIGINGSGKSNFIKALKLLKEGVSGYGLRKYVLDELGGLDNILFKKATSENNNTCSLQFIFTPENLHLYGYKGQLQITYAIALTKIQGTANFYVSEKVFDDNGMVFLDFTNGTGRLNEKSNEKLADELVPYLDFVETGNLALSRIFDNQLYPTLTALRKAIGDIEIYDQFNTASSGNIRQPVLPTSEKRLLPNGENLTQILNTLKINDKQAYQKIVQQLQRVNAMFQGFDFHFIGGRIELLLDEMGLNSSIHISHISDGTLKYLCLLSILYNPERGGLICINEPETGLHPDMLSSIGEAMLEVGIHCQMIISTHSDTLLNAFDIKHIRVFEKNDVNATKIHTLNAQNFEGWYEEFSAGKMWRAGDLGGNRW